MEIQVGEYVRTKYGVILKFKGYLSEYLYIDSLNYEDAIVNFKTTKALYENSRGNVYVGRSKDIVKHSFNIIDLIQKGDIVNGFKVFGIYNREVDGVKVVSNTPDEDFYNESVSNEEIYSVLTKEQFKAMEYEVK